MAAPPRRSRADRVRGSFRAGLGDLARPARLLLAAKAALAASVAWYLAPLLPFADDSYKYYAPLGVLVSMYPTVSDSLRAGLLAIAGLALGIGLGLAGLTGVILGAPAVVAIFFVIGIGVLFGGVRRLGAGRDWVAIAGIFVLLLGGADADSFSVSYIVTMAFGVVVGIVVNLVLVPPLYLREADQGLSSLRDGVTRCLDDLADAIEKGDLDAARLSGDVERLSEQSREIADDVREAEQSAKVNPRSRRHAHERSRNTQRLPALDRSALHTRELAETVARMADASDDALHGASRDALIAAIRSTSELVATPDGGPGGPDALRHATDELAAFVDASSLGGDAASSVTDAMVCAVSLRRIIDASRPFVH